MSEYWYVSVVERNNEGRFFAHIPDLPGVTAAGASPAEALAMVAEIGADHAQDYVENGHVLPPPRDLTEVPHDPEVKEFGRALVPVPVPGESVKISISVDKALLQSADRAAAREGLTRSAYIAAAIGSRMRGALRRPITTAQARHVMLVPVDEYEGGAQLIDTETRRMRRSVRTVPPRKRR